MSTFRKPILSMIRQSGWKLAVIFGFSALLVIGLLLARSNPSSAAKAAGSPTITSDQQDYQPGATVTLTGAGWAANEDVQIFVNDSVGNTWSLTSGQNGAPADPVADTNGGFTYSFSLPNTLIANYTATATGATSGTATTTFTDTNTNCPSSPSASQVQQNDPYVSASFTISGNTATYTFTGASTSSTSGAGLIEYCVYNTPVPTSLTPSLSTWSATSPLATPFGYIRDTGGNNVPYDGTSHTIGTAMFSVSIPTSQSFVLHVNDPFCGTAGTCFVTPGVAQNLTVSKTAATSFTRTYNWSISKSVDQTRQNIAAGGSATFNYTVTASETGFTDSAWQVTGQITVSNPNAIPVDNVTVTDAIDNGGNCSVSGGTGVSVPAKSGSVDGSVTLDYTCTYPDTGPSKSSGTNTATATWPAIGSPSTTATGTATYTFGAPTTKVNQTVTVTDAFNGGAPTTLGTLTATDSTPFTSKSFTESQTVSGVAGTCTDYPNIATIVETKQTADASVKVCVGADLTVSKTAKPSFTRTFTWGITKSVDKTEIDTASGGSATFNYTVSVTHDAGTDSAWAVSGTITVKNPNDWEAITTDVTDAIDNGGTCSVTGGSAVSVPAGQSVTLPYTCTFSSNPGSGTNTATATWNSATFFTPGGSATGTAGYAFGAPTTKVNQTITVTDSYKGTLGTATATDSTPFTSKTFTYARTVNVPQFGCKTYPNTATIVETGLTASASVTVCGPVQTGALTMGFWQNKNGQAILTNGASTAGVCNSGTWLRQYAPFQDLSANATCSQVATYVYNIIKAANASGSSMNPMLKAQMLATSLDVYFSDPALGGNKIGAPAPIGGVTIDLTKICAMIDGSGGTATCSSSFENVSSAFGGATSLTVSQMLAYAASQSNAGGITWYGQNKTTQGLAKDAFDAINNQVAFSP